MGGVQRVSIRVELIRLSKNEDRRTTATARHRHTSHQDRSHASLTRTLHTTMRSVSRVIVRGGRMSTDAAATHASRTGRLRVRVRMPPVRRAHGASRPAGATCARPIRAVRRRVEPATEFALLARTGCRQLATRFNRALEVYRGRSRTTEKDGAPLCEAKNVEDETAAITRT